MFEVASAAAPTYSRQLSDEQLMMMTRAGSSEAFGELVERHYDRLAFYIGQVLGDADSAEDLAQETFLRAFRARVLGVNYFSPSATIRIPDRFLVFGGAVPG